MVGTFEPSTAIVQLRTSFSPQCIQLSSTIKTKLSIAAFSVTFVIEAVNRNVWLAVA
jgi:hypothetical protein